MASNDSRMSSALLAAVVVLGLSHVVGGPRPAAAQQAGGEHMFAVVAPGVGGPGSNVLFLIDPPGGRLAVYEHRAGAKLELVAVRDITNELQFQEWTPKGNAARVQAPSVGEIMETLEEQKKKQNARQGG